MRSKELRLNLKENSDLDFFDTDRYNTPQKVFDFYHTESKDPDEKMTRGEKRTYNKDFSAAIKLLAYKKAAIIRNENKEKF